LAETGFQVLLWLPAKQFLVAGWVAAGIAKPLEIARESDYTIPWANANLTGKLYNHTDGQ
jgi:hypothetical protein